MLLCFIACKNDTENEELSYEPFEHIQLIAHGGDCINCPQNTMPAFESAVNNLGLHWIETDPQLTKDGVFVLFHDNTLSSYMSGEVKDYDFDELLEIDFAYPEKFGKKYSGTKICTAEQAISFCKKNNVILEFDFGHFEVNIENVQKLWNLVCKYDYKNGVIFEPYNEIHLKTILSVSNEPNIIYVGCDKNLDIPELLRQFKFVVIGLNYLKVGTETDLATKIHDFGYKAASSVINPVPENSIEKLNELIDMGFDYIYVGSIPYSAIKTKTE
ncbi:MAG: hypothetical protein J6K96_01785 [Treponema sp.]|nr:hypothetical protein [Treponema sp.]